MHPKSSAQNRLSILEVSKKFKGELQNIYCIWASLAIFPTPRDLTFYLHVYHIGMHEYIDVVVRDKIL